MEWYLYILTPLLGILTGFINTLAGSGSLLILPFLIFMGLPATDANATNRVGVLIQTFVSSFAFRQKIIEQFGEIWPMLLSGTIGAGFGASLASAMSPSTMKIVIACVMGIMLLLVSTNTKKWLRQSDEMPELGKRLAMTILFVAVGFYGGFIQAGVGIFILATLVLLSGFSLQQANVFKNLFTFLITIPAIFIFAIKGQIHWEAGLVLAAGQAVGAWIAAKFASESPKAAKYTHRLLITMLVLSSLKLIWDYLFT